MNTLRHEVIRQSGFALNKTGEFECLAILALLLRDTTASI